MLYQVCKFQENLISMNKIPHRSYINGGDYLISYRFDLLSLLQNNDYADMQVCANNLS